MKRLLPLITLLTAFLSGISQTPTPLQVELQTFTNAVASPVGVYNAGDDRVFVVEQNEADIEIFDLSGVYIGKFLDLSGTVYTSGSEQGLLGLAFHPDYATNGKFYVNYSYNGTTAQDGDTHVSEFTVSADPNVADAGSEVVLLNIEQPAGNHNGGHIAFGSDGMLYIGMGDGGSAGDPWDNSQTESELLGKMLRINVPGDGTYSIPPDNPFVGSPTVLDEIWAFGLRNPWQFSFDRETGDLWIADVGQNIWEEVDFQPASSSGGENWGWRCYEGNATYNTTGCGAMGTYDFPVAVYNHGGSDNFCSITGGYVYRGAEYEDMTGHYFFTDYCNGEIYSLKSDGMGGWDELIVNGNNEFGYSAFGEDVNGEIYLCDLGGTVYKLYDPCDSFTPVIDLITGDLQASAGVDYYWYQDDVLVPGNNSQWYTPPGPGSYYCVVDDGAGCAKPTNTLDLELSIVGIPGCTYIDSPEYDPDATVDDGSCTFFDTNPCPEDLNGDGFVNTPDLLQFLSSFGNAC